MEVIIDGVHYEPIRPFTEQVKIHADGVNHACRMLETFMARTHEDLLDFGTLDLVNIVKAETHRLNSQPKG